MSDFEVGECQHQGPFASVHRCEYKLSGDVFAMRRLPKKNYVQRAGVKRDRDALSFVSHPNIVSLHWLFELANDWILILEFCDMGTLRQYIDKNGEPGISVEDSQTICKNVLAGLAFLHSRRVLHRDVHPTNVSLSGPEESLSAKLSDTSFAKRSQRGRVMGSDGYRAPEIAIEMRRLGALRQVSNHFDETIDLYSVGVLVFVTLVGVEAKSSEGRIWQHQEFRSMLEDADHYLWHCDAYQDAGVFGLCQLSDMEDCGAIATISALTETNPKRRIQTAAAAAARQLPFFIDKPEDCGDVASQDSEDSFEIASDATAYEVA